MARFYSITNPPPVGAQDFTGVVSLTDPSQDESLGSLVRKLLSGTVVAPKSDVSFDTEDITKVSDIDDFMKRNESLRPGYVDVSDAQVYAELAKETIARLKRDSKASKINSASEPLKIEKVESEEALDRSNEDLSGNKD